MHAGRYTARPADLKSKGALGSWPGAEKSPHQEEPGSGRPAGWNMYQRTAISPNPEVLSTGTARDGRSFRRGSLG